ncbi:hypothetical protein T459_05004 [Capsicum annuum]|uniref:Uncharacterized protein n=1 Tax=Capsicum annuum TaxID=4072 RepID=A0A2G3A6S5_CAPAN|nr:hypothetical protein T459_05004 [Capsicum annuum]
MIVIRQKNVRIRFRYPVYDGVIGSEYGWSGKPVIEHNTCYRMRWGFSLEDATGLSLNGDIDVDSVFAASLPATYSHFAPQKHLDMSKLMENTVSP